jgi:molybdopterin synthase catalytic subunit
MSQSLIAVSEEPISAQELKDMVSRDAAGAIVTFEGTVRDHSGEHATEYLEYEAYGAMAVKVLGDIVDAVKEKLPILGVAVHHRTGRLEVGEVSVAIAVSAEHRGAAFDGCRYIIDELKLAAPIWKKEVGADGSEWVSGPVPAAESGGENS